MAINPARPREIYIALQGSRSIFRSTDRGDIWTDITGNIQGVVPNTLAIGPTGERLYLGSGNGLYVLALPTSAGPSDQSSPKAIQLNQNFPNPFNPSTTITYRIPRTTHVTIRVFNTLGQQVALLADENKPVGQNTTIFDANALAGGVYFYQLQADGSVQTRKMILIK